MHNRFRLTTMGRTPRSLSYSKSQQARGSFQLVQGALLSLFLIAAADSYGLETPKYEVLYTLSLITI